MEQMEKVEQSAREGNVRFFVVVGVVVAVLVYAACVGPEYFMDVLGIIVQGLSVFSFLK